MLDLKNIIENSGVLDAIDVNRESVHRTKNDIKRSTSEVVLNTLADEIKEYIKTQKDPTDDLISVPPGLDHVDITGFIPTSGYLIYDPQTLQTWCAPTKLCLNQNFIYRDDIEIVEYKEHTGAINFYKERGSIVNPGIFTRKVCYLLDNPANETYEVYYDSSYPARQYGQSTPKGCCVHKYLNRFHRDMAILQLDALYSKSSVHDASKIISK